jgi:HSP20 family protein
MNRLQREMNRLFGDFQPGRIQSAPSFPAMNVWAGENSALITAEIPGIDKKDLEINVTGNTLTVSGERKLEDLPEGARYHRQERAHGKFSRSIQLPYTVDVQKVKANFKNGVLKIDLPRVEEEKPKKITVKAS